MPTVAIIPGFQRELTYHPLLSLSIVLITQGFQRVNHQKLDQMLDRLCCLSSWLEIDCCLCFGSGY